MGDWSTHEVQLVVADYLAMLAKEMAGEPYNKSAFRRALQPFLNNRSESSIEFKRQNISAALIELGACYIKGYLPLLNRQELLVEECARQLEADKLKWDAVFTQFTAAVTAPGKDYTLDTLIDTPPEYVNDHPVASTRLRKPFKINYLEREQRNNATGVLGEQIVMAYEKWRLMQAGKPQLAEKIEWVAQFNDQAGFDILSKHESGQDKYIEVKSTKLGKATPIFFSHDEFNFARSHRSAYHLYRVFNLSESPRLFTLQGDFDSFCRKEAIQYKGYFS